MDKAKMSGTGTQHVPRPRDPPSPEEVLDRMVKNRCYVVADLAATFEDEYSPSRGTVRNRLEHLVESDEVVRRKHANGAVTYRRR
jgi:hypothetical protein